MTAEATKAVPAQTPAELRRGLLADLERRQAEVDVAQDEYDLAHEKANDTRREAQTKSFELDRAKARRDKALDELEQALPQRDPEHDAESEGKR